MLVLTLTSWRMKEKYNLPEGVNFGGSGLAPDQMEKVAKVAEPPFRRQISMIRSVRCQYMNDRCQYMNDELSILE